MIKNVPYFDIHDKDLSPVIYHLIFSYFHSDDNFCNDAVHWLDIQDMKEMHEEHENEAEDDPYAHPAFAEFNERMANPDGRCYCDKTQLKALKARKKPPTFIEAVAELEQWLAEQGVRPSDSVLVKVWW